MFSLTTIVRYDEVPIVKNEFTISNSRNRCKNLFLILKPHWKTGKERIILSNFETSESFYHEPRFKSEKKSPETQDHFYLRT